MVTSSLLTLDIQGLLQRAEHLAGTKLPREVVEVTLEGELGEPAHPQVHLFRDKASEKITAVELLEIDEFST